MGYFQQAAQLLRITSTRFVPDSCVGMLTEGVSRVPITEQRLLLLRGSGDLSNHAAMRRRIIYIQQCKHD